MKKIFVTATNTDIGKTYTTLKLLQQFAKEGLHVAAVKPIETGVKEVPQDGLKLLSMQQTLNPRLKELQMKHVTPVTFELPAAPFIASGGKEIDTSVIHEAIEYFEDKCDILLIEGAGGLYVPINKEYFMIDLIEELHVDATLLVSHCSLGCINDTLLSLKALLHKGLPHTVAFNCKSSAQEEEFKLISKPFFDASGFALNMLQKDIRRIASILYNL